MPTQTACIEYLPGTLTKYTCTHLAAHLPDAGHDQVNRFVRNSQLPVSQLCEMVQPLLHDSPGAFHLVDDSARDKKDSRFIEVAKRRYSGKAHGTVTGIGLVNRVHSSNQAGDFWPLDSASTRRTATSSRKTTIFWPCLTVPWPRARCGRAPFFRFLVRRQHQPEAHSPR